MKNSINLFIDGRLPLNIDKNNYSTNLDFWIMGCIYQGIRMYDKSYKLSDRLLTYFDFNDVTSKYILKFKKITDSSGKLLSIEDIKKSIEDNLKNIREGNKQKYNDILGIKRFFLSLDNNISGIEVINQNTMYIHVNKKNLNIENLLLLPVGVASQTVDKITNYGDLNLIGIGPYIPYKVGVDVVNFVRNRYFHLGIPKIKNMNIYFGNTEKKKKYILEKKIDFFQINKNDLELLHFVPDNYRIYGLESLNTSCIFFNFEIEKMKSIEVRRFIQKLIYSIDYKREVCFGYAENIYDFYPNVLKKSFQIEKSFYKSNNDFSNIYMDKIIIGYKRGECFQKKVLELIKDRVKNIVNIEIKESLNMKESFSLGADLFITDLLHQILPISNGFVFEYIESLNDRSFTKLKDNIKILKYNNSICNILNFISEINNVIPLISFLSFNDIQVIDKKFKNLSPDARGVLWNIHEIYYKEN